MWNLKAKTQYISGLGLQVSSPMCRWNLKAKTLTHLEALFLRTSFPSDYIYSSTSLQTMVYSPNLVISSYQNNVPIHFSSLNSALLCKHMEMYS